MIIDIEDYLAHYGTPRRSGRYPWGSGGEDGSGTHRNPTFMDDVAKLKKAGYTEAQIAKNFEMTTTQLRAARSIAVNQERQHKIMQAQRLKDTGMSTSAIGREMGLPESSVRSLLVPGAKDKADILTTVSGVLKKRVDEDKYIDVGEGVENHLGITNQRLKTAVAVLEEQGYVVHQVQIPQLTGGNNKTTVKVLTPPGTTYQDAKANRDNIRQIGAFSEDGGRTLLNIQTPLDISSSRIAVNYSQKNAKGEEIGGGNADGVLYIRRGVEDVSIGKNAYAQVRISVDGTHYLKGMAVYKDDLPKGVDIVFNTNKKDTGNKLDAMKKQGDDPDNPFGSIVRQITHPETGKVTSAMNIVGYKPGSGEEGAWGGWSKNLAPQLLSKQSPLLAKKQLDMTFESKKNEFDEIMGLTNPAVKRKLLESLADSADSSAVHLKAAKIPRQATHVIMPVQSLKPHEVYAPNYNNGEIVALVRFPHAGTFEIPELVVNNSNREARKLLDSPGKRATDAVGIHPKVAERLSGADFDGDFVVVIPNNNRQIKSSPALKGLKDFDVQKYKLPEDAPRMTSRTKGQQMGLVSNLITDMTIKGANPDEMARAVRHSMVVIDAEKHHLDYKQSAKDNGIKALNIKYQEGKPQGGASTLISRAKGKAVVPDYKLRSAKDGGPIDPKTGKLQYESQPKSFVDRYGNTQVLTRVSKKLAETDNAHTLVSKNPDQIELIYADHSNRMKGLANEARKELVKIKPPLMSTSAKKTYSSEVESLKAKLELARRNKPLERQAQVFANAVVNQKKAANPHMDAAQLKKIKTQALEAQRARVQAGKKKIIPTQKEWDAIQAGAISNHQLTQILQNTDLDVIKALATPHTTILMSPAKTSRANEMLSAGYTQAEVASHLGVSVSTLKTAIE